MLPIAVILFVIVGAFSWKLLGETKTASRTLKGLPTYGAVTNSSGESSFGSTKQTSDITAANPVTADVDKELQDLLKEDDTSDLEALGKQVSSL